MPSNIHDYRITANHSSPFFNTEENFCRLHIYTTIVTILGGHTGADLSTVVYDASIAAEAGKSVQRKNTPSQKMGR